MNWDEKDDSTVKMWLLDALNLSVLSEANVFQMLGASSGFISTSSSVSVLVFGTNNQKGSLKDVNALLPSSHVQLVF